MMILITYDVSTQKPSGLKRLRKVAKICCNYGQRVQNSVFECDIDPAQYVSVKAQLLEIISKTEDSLRIYRLGNSYRSKIEMFGKVTSFDPEGELIY